MVNLRKLAFARPCVPPSLPMHHTTFRLQDARSWTYVCRRLIDFLRLFCSCVGIVFVDVCFGNGSHTLQGALNGMALTPRIAKSVPNIGRYVVLSFHSRCHLCPGTCPRFDTHLLALPRSLTTFLSKFTITFQFT